MRSEAQAAHELTRHRMASRKEAHFTPISNLQPRPVSTRHRPVLVSSSGLATSPIRSRPTSTAPTSPASSIIVAPPTEVPTDTEDYDDVASSNMAEEPVGDF